MFPKISFSLEPVVCSAKVNPSKALSVGFKCVQFGSDVVCSVRGVFCLGLMVVRSSVDSFGFVTAGVVCNEVVGNSGFVVID